MKEVMMEDQKGEEATAAAATAVELPNSTASAMETGRDGEGPDSGGPPAHPDPTQRPLECLMRDMGLEAKDGDIIFPITPVGRPPPYNHELSAENHKRGRGSNEENMLSPPPSNPQCWDSETGGKGPGGAPHGSVY